MAQRRAHAVDLVRGDLLALPGPAEHDRPVGRPGHDRACGRGAERRVVDRLGGVGAEVEHLVALAREERPQLLLQREARVVGAEARSRIRPSSPGEERPRGGRTGRRAPPPPRGTCRSASPSGSATSSSTPRRTVRRSRAAATRAERAGPRCDDVLEQADELLQRERPGRRLRTQPDDRVAMLARHAHDEVRVADHRRRSSRRARCPPMSTPRSAAAWTDSGSPPSPPTRRCPPTRRPAPLAEPLVERARRNPSAIGERQMFPVQTTRIEAMTKGASLAAGSVRTGARRSPSPGRPLAQDPRGRARGRHRGGDPVERSLLAQVDGDGVAEQRPGARRRSRRAARPSGSRS